MLNNWKPFKVITAGEFINSQEQIEQYYRVVIQVPGFTTLEEFEGTLEECEKEAAHLNQLISASLALHIENNK